MPTRLLCVGDIHLGRRPTRLPEGLGDWGLAPGDLTPAAAWLRVVDRAIALEVHGVLLAGDVVDADNRFFEAYGPLLAGVTRLKEHGIPVVGVAGNHDFEVLPRLADELREGFTLLGRDGRWEEHVLAPPGHQAVRLLGWSFPQKVVRTSPFDTRPPVSDDLPLVGLLHCDLDGAGSPYAPVSSASLGAAPGEAWLLGHVHAPSALSSAASRGYLGCLSALDPGESGPRGAWLLEVRGRGALALERLPVAPLRWENVAVDVSGLTDPDGLEGALTRSLHELHARIDGSLGETRAIGCRLRLVGQTPIHRALAAALAKAEACALRLFLDGHLYFVDSFGDEARETLDLEDLARSADPPGLLARMLLDVEHGTDAGRALVASATVELAKVAALGNWTALDPVPDPEAEARRHLLASGRHALEELLARRELP